MNVVEEIGRYRKIPNPSLVVAYVLATEDNPDWSRIKDLAFAAAIQLEHRAISLYQEDDGAGRKEMRLSELADELYIYAGERE